MRESEFSYLSMTGKRMVIDQGAGAIIAEHTIDIEKNYQPSKGTMT